MKNILEISASKALDYFLQSTNYSTLSLPKYFSFDNILQFVKNKVGKKTLNECLKDNKNPSDYEKVNYNLLVNKDGRYAYRPLQLANPFLYYFLVKEITAQNNWKLLKRRFEEFKKDSIEVLSIPMLKEKKDKSVLATTINSWLEHIEQRSIELSLKYKYIFITDITNCYGSIYTHSIPWALHGRDYAKLNKQKKDLLGNTIDKYIMGMQYGQTNGIPQGGVLFDFIAEMVLGYADLLLYDELQEKKIHKYKILRYRDDYRIFSNSKEELETIAMTLQNILAKLNFQLNGSKTKLCENIIESSVKADKLFYLSNIPIYKGKETVFNTLQQELLYILCLSKQYSNSGTICKLLNTFLERIFERDILLENENVGVLLAIVVEIAMNSPKVYNLTVAIISKLITHLDTNAKRETMTKNIVNKFSRLPNIGYLQLWMQRITFTMNTQMGYTEPLCKIVENNSNVQIWNNEWLKDEYTMEFPLYSICTNWIRDEFTPIINIDEVSIFDY